MPGASQLDKAVTVITKVHDIRRRPVPAGDDDRLRAETYDSLGRFSYVAFRFDRNSSESLGFKPIGGDATGKREKCAGEDVNRIRVEQWRPSAGAKNGVDDKRRQ